jgi:hypothetical protein
MDLILGLSGCSTSLSTVDRFLKRHDDIKLTGSSGIDPVRADQADDELRRIYFTKLQNFIRTLNKFGKVPWKKYEDIPSEAIHNYDELSSETHKRRKKTVGDAAMRDRRQFSITP